MAASSAPQAWTLSYSSPALAVLRPKPSTISDGLRPSAWATSPAKVQAAAATNPPTVTTMGLPKAKPAPPSPIPTRTPTAPPPRTDRRRVPLDPRQPTPRARGQAIPANVARPSAAPRSPPSRASAPPRGQSSLLRNAAAAINVDAMPPAPASNGPSSRPKATCVRQPSSNPRTAPPPMPTRARVGSRPAASMASPAKARMNPVTRKVVPRPAMRTLHMAFRPRMKKMADAMYRAGTA